MHIGRDVMDAEYAVQAVMSSVAPVQMSLVREARQHLQQSSFRSTHHQPSIPNIPQHQKVDELMPVSVHTSSHRVARGSGSSSDRRSISPLLPQSVDGAMTTTPSQSLIALAKSSSSRQVVAGRATAAVAASAGGIRAATKTASVRKGMIPPQSTATNTMSAMAVAFRSNNSGDSGEGEGEPPSPQVVPTPKSLAPPTASASIRRHMLSDLSSQLSQGSGMLALDEPVVRMTPKAYHTPIRSVDTTPSSIPISFGSRPARVMTPTTLGDSSTSIATHQSPADESALQRAADMALEVGVDPQRPVAQYLQVRMDGLCIR